MNKIYFAIALHFHQPTGNFDHIFERAYQSCYRPLLELLSEYSDLKVTVHISGCLLDYLESKHPEVIKLIKNMVTRRQVEIMGGGYYEPIFTAIPGRDLTGQIEMMSEHIKNKFNFIPRGLWLPERIWHPDLTETLYKTGMRYLIVDDEHLLRSGVKKEDMHGYFLTGKGKEKLAVFPSDKKLRYNIPFRLPQETIDYFKNAAEKKKRLLFTYGDDGEKFGEWPGTYEWVFEKQWLRNFFNLLRQNKDWIEPVHFSDYLKNHEPTATLLIKEGSYQEMMEWSGGSWNNFLLKYPEADQMHKKMLYVSSKIEKIEKQFKLKKIKEVEKARKYLYSGQCNCAYWHGVFGGLYLYHLRRAVYNHLITAEKIADTLQHKFNKSWFEIHKLDFDSDGKDEIIIENNNFSIYVDPGDGGVIKELDYRPLSFNLVNTLSRKKEFYHQKILHSLPKSDNSKIATIHDDFRVVDSNFKNMLFYDRYPRFCLRSYFLKKDLKLERFVNSSYEEIGDFSQGAYTAKIADKSLILQRQSKLLGQKILLSKYIKVEAENEISIWCAVTRKDLFKLQAVFGLEFNLTMPDLNAERYHCHFKGADKKNLNEEGYTPPIFNFGIKDSSGELGLDFQFSKEPANVCYFPVRTISQSERAYELNYQCSSLFFLWNVDFAKEVNNNFCLNFRFIPSTGQ